MSERTIHDISVPISESLVVWPGDTTVRMEHSSHLARGDAATVTHLEMSAHTGTHVDAPAHFILGGDDVASLALDALIGPAVVAAYPGDDHITAADLAAMSIPTGTTRVLFHTKNSEIWGNEAAAATFQKDFIGITEDGARWLVEHGVRLVGIDYLSAAPFTASVPTHRVLLEAGVIILEGIDLSGIDAGAYELCCLPLKLADSDGAPARAVLIAT
jgi:arylformamidase